ncbi:dynamin family protein [Moorena sp. SIOASIH]|uniref:dynamin family protein n=1 Tax=Moorena sp. SIOASIH TaxID=2607817 RepID=UPI0025FAE0C0|nr:dynamin family protein [Moorena sp. SIOASIH]
MAKALPGKKGLWGQMKQFGSNVLDCITPGSRGARITANAYLENNQNLIAYNQTRDQLQEQIEAAKMDLQVVMQHKSLEFQANEGQLNRQLKEYLATLNQAFNRNEGKLNRELQADIARLNREFQVNEGKLNRQHTAEIESFRAQLQIFLQERQNDLQVQLSENQATLQKELAIYHRETSLLVIREKRRQDNWPLTLDEEQIIELIDSQNELLVLFSPPTLRYDRAGNRNKATADFSDMELRLGQGLRWFFGKYTKNGRPINCQSGLWKTKAFHSEGANSPLFRSLRPIPTVFLDILLEEDTYHFNCGSWNSTYNKPDLKSIPEDPDFNPSWRQFLEDCDPDELRRFLSVQLYLLAGRKADEHFLLNVHPRERQRPLLPELLPELLQKVPEEYREDVIEMVVSGCIALYGVLEEEESAWVPELKLDLALSLSVLEDKSWAREQFKESLQSWLQLRGLPQPEGRQALLDEVVTNMTSADVDYHDKIVECLKSLGDIQQSQQILDIFTKNRRTKMISSEFQNTYIQIKNAGNNLLEFIEDNVRASDDDYEVDIQGLQTIKRDIEKSLEALDNQQYNVAVIAPIKAGKSTFLNAIIGADILASETAACTVCRTGVRHINSGTPELWEYREGQDKPLVIAEGDSTNIVKTFLDRTREIREQSNQDKVTYFELWHPIEAISDYSSLAGFTLVDTPGPNEWESTGFNTAELKRVSLEAVRTCDAILFILDYTSFKDEASSELFKELLNSRK